MEAGNAFQRHVVRLSCTRGEYDILRIGANEVRNVLGTHSQWRRRWEEATDQPFERPPRLSQPPTRTHVFENAGYHIDQ